MNAPQRIMLKAIGYTTIALGLGGLASSASALDQTPPIVSLSSPFASNVVTEEAQVFVTPAASDAGGVARVELYQNGVHVSTDSSAPYKFYRSFTESDNGSMSLQAKAVDVAGNVGSSNTVQLQVAIGDSAPPPEDEPADTSSPTVQILTNLVSDEVTHPVAIGIVYAYALDDTGVTRVDFFDNGQLVRSDFEFPFFYWWSIDAADNGTHNWTARAYDAAGNDGDGSRVFTVAIGNTDTIAPTIAFTTPSDEIPLTTAGTLPVSVSASDVGTGVDRVDFYHDGTLMGSDSSAPYQTSWTVDASDNGSHLWGAIAYDGADNQAIVGQRVIVDIATGNGGPVFDGEPEVVGFVEGIGEASGVAIRNRIAYSASPEFGLTVVDFNDSYRPKILATADRAFKGLQVSVDGGLALVGGVGANQMIEIVTIDVSDPSRPRVLGTLATNIHEVHLNDVDLIAGGSAGVITLGGYGAWIVDLADPRNPKRVASSFLPTAKAIGFDYDTAGRRGLLAVVDGLEILNLDNPKYPSSLGKVRITGSMTGIDYDGGYAFVSDVQGALHVVEISSQRLRSSVFTGGVPVDVSVDQGIAAVMVQLSDEAVINRFDVSPPTDPRMLTSTPIGQYAYDVVSDGGRIYAATGLDGIEAVDNGNGVWLAQINDHLKPRAVHGAQQVALVLAQDTRNDKTSIVSIDTSNTVSPIVAGRIDTTISEQLAKDALVHPGGSFGLVALSHEGVWSIDLTSPAAPRILAKLAVPESAEALAFSQDGKTVFVATRYDVQAVDVSNPSAPRVVGRVDGVRYSRDMAISGTHIYVTQISGTVVVYDVSSPTAMREVTSYNRYGDLVAAAGDILAIGDWTSGGDYLEVVDISDPSRPTSVGYVQVDAPVKGLLVAGDRVLIAGAEAGLLEFEITAGTPRLLADDLPVDEPLAISADADGMIYVGDFPSPLSLIRMDGN